MRSCCFRHYAGYLLIYKFNVIGETMVINLCGQKDNQFLVQGLWLIGLHSLHPSVSQCDWNLLTSKTAERQH